MKIKFILLSIAACCILSFNKDKDSINIWLEQTKVDKVVEYEKKLAPDSEFPIMNISLSASVYPKIDQYTIAKPFIAQRKQTGFLPVYAEYFYSVPDSTLRYISYDWERERYGNLFAKQKIWEQESKKLKKYNAEYERIKSEVVKKFGKPATEDTEPQKKKSTSGRDDYLFRETVWDNDDYHAKLSMIFESMTYRIRLNYYWKN